jgi:predicted PurR-regulated permease PerM
MIHRPSTSLSGGPTGRPRRTAPHPPRPLGARVAWLLTFMAVFSGLFWVLWPVFSVLFASAGFAYLLDPVVDRLERRGWKREVAIGALFTAALVGLLGIVLAVVPSVAAQIADLSVNVRRYVDNLAALIQPAAAFIETQTGHAIPVDFATLKQEMPGWLEKLSPNARESIQQFIGGMFSSGFGFFTAMVNLALLPVFTFYLLRDWDHLIAFIADLVPHRHRERVGRLTKEVDTRLAAFVRGQITVCACLALIYSMGLWISGIDMAFTVGILAGALFIVPYLGSVVGLVLACVLSTMEFGFDIHLLYVGLTFGIAQAIEGWFLTPFIVGDKVGLHPLVVMIALLVGGSLGGIWGMFLAIPVTAVLNVLATEWIDVYRASGVFNEDT